MILCQKNKLQADCQDVALLVSFKVNQQTILQWEAV